MNLTVVIPTYNEAENLPVLLPRIFALGLQTLKILIVDDDSPDGTTAVAQGLANVYPGQVEVLCRQGLKRGLGAAYIDGLQKAVADGAAVVISMDADCSHNPIHIPPMLALMAQGDMVVGSRYIAGGGVDGPWGWNRVVLSTLAQGYIRTILGIKTRDATSAFRCYTRAALERLSLAGMEPDGYTFLIEAVFRAERMGLKILEHPIRFRDREKGESKVSVSVITNALFDILKIRFKG